MPAGCVSWVLGEVLGLYCRTCLPAVNSNYYTVDSREIPTPYQLDRASEYVHQLLVLVTICVVSVDGCVSYHNCTYTDYLSFQLLLYIRMYIVSFFHFRFMDDCDNGRGEKNIISQGIVPFDSYFYDHLIRGVRIPGEECDTLQHHKGSTHIVVVK